MERECKLLFYSRLDRFTTFIKQTDPSLLVSGPLANLKRVLLGNLEEEANKLILVIRNNDTEDLILQIFNRFEERTNEYYAQLEIENSELRGENGELRTPQEKVLAKNEELMAELAQLKVQISLAKAAVSQIREDFECLIKDPEKLKTALKVVTDILDSCGEEPQKPPRCHYNIEVVKIAILTVVHARCSFRSAIAVLGIFKKYLPYLSNDKAPAYTTVRYWVIKSGLGLAPLLKKRITGKYVFIVDESIVLNKQKMLVVLATRSLRKKGKAVSFRVVSIAHMEVREGWSNKDISEVLKKSRVRDWKKPGVSFIL